MEIAPDFFSYMQAGSRLMQRDPSLYCVSAWNDHGKGKLVADPRELRRTDVFPGLGWLLTASVWREIGPRWPRNYWDEWMRSPEQRRGRQCLYPEISRTYTFGKSGGASQGQFFDEHLAPIKLNSVVVDWTGEELGGLSPEDYDRTQAAALASALPLSLAELRSMTPGTTYSCVYDGEHGFNDWARALDLLPGFKEGSPRGAFRGVLKVRFMGAILYLAPQ
jgi:alpha-1,3-mannosyl-glycoprotein beta-1,2-N-acetylglucosaminyltransferase